MVSVAPIPGLPGCPRLVPQKPSDPRELAGSSQTETDERRLTFHQFFCSNFCKEGYDLVGIKKNYIYDIDLNGRRQCNLYFVCNRFECCCEQTAFQTCCDSF